MGVSHIKASSPREEGRDRTESEGPRTKRKGESEIDKTGAEQEAQEVNSGKGECVITDCCRQGLNEN